MDERKDRVKIPLTDEMKQRLRDLHKQYHKSSGAIASALRISKDSYKNLTSPSRGIKFIKRELLYRLADIYECSVDYLLCKSDDPKLNHEGKEVTRPLIWPLDRMIESVSSYLYNDPDTLESVYTLTCLLDEDGRKKVLTAMNFVVETLKAGLLLDRKDKMDYELREYLSNAFHYNDIDYTCALNCLVEGDEFVEKGTKFYQFALDRYLRVIYIEITLSPYGKSNGLKFLRPKQIKPLAEEARKKICSLRKAWGSFPESISPIVDTFSCAESATDGDDQKSMDREKIIAVIEKRLKIHKEKEIAEPGATEDAEASTPEETGISVDIEKK